ncbi:MAG: SpoIIE family protein phosphatase [Thermanaerothrix sp.]|nr:SpoIIE family protein phosphatase [Thermanaerothrix sp.]
MEGENLSFVFNYHPDLLFVLDRTGRVLEAGLPAAFLLGLSLDALRGSDFANFLPEDQRESFRSFISRERMLRIGRYSLLGSSGKPLEMELHFARGCWNGGDALFVTAIDLSERLRSEAQAEVYLEELEIMTVKLREAQRALEEEFAKAANIHRKLLPKIPPMDGIEGAAYFEPASKIGGDFYEVMTVGGQVLAYLVDVSGHGLDGALISLFVREWVSDWARSLKGSLEPELLVRSAAQRFAEEEMLYDYFICIQAAVINPDTGLCKVVNAGNHVRPMLFVPGKGAKFLDAVGTPVAGLGDMETLQSVRVSFPRGARLLMCTDGMADQEAGAVRFGPRRVKEAFEGASHLGPQGILDRIAQEFKAFLNGSPTRDDVTMLCFGR